MSKMIHCIIKAAQAQSQAMIDKLLNWFVLIEINWETLIDSYSYPIGKVVTVTTN